MVRHRSIMKAIPFFLPIVLTLPAGAPATDVGIVAGGASAWRIAVPAGSPGEVAFAAGELRAYVRHMTGCSIPIVETPAEGPRIVLGLRSALPAADAALLPPEPAGHDGYAVAVRAGGADGPPRIALGAANGRGAVYGAYDLLEQWGCRFFYPARDPQDPEIVPARNTLSLPEGSWALASPIRYRIANTSGWFFKMDPATALADLDWAMKARYNAIGWQCENSVPIDAQYARLDGAGIMAALRKRGLLLHGPAHSFDFFLKAETYMAKHPEWFGLRDGKRVPQTFLGAQFCWSNAGARAEFARNVESFVRACPAISILCIVPFDGGVACACDRCVAEGASALLLKVVGEVIGRLETSAPEVLVETVGGYGPMTEPPADPAAAHPLQRIVWAHWGRHHGMGYDDPRYDRKANLEAWRGAALGGLTLCQYYSDNFSEPWVMPPFTLAIEGDRRYVLEKGIDAVYVMMYPRGYWWNHGLNAWLAGRAFHDVSASPLDGIREWALSYFGPRAGPLLGAMYDDWARDVDLGYRIRGGARPDDRALLAAWRKDRIEPAAKLVSGDPVLARRVARVEALHGLAEMQLDAQAIHEEVRAARGRGDWAAAEETLRRGRKAAADTIARFGAVAALDQGLVDRDEVPGFITLLLQGWLEEESKRIAARERG
jgi:hypothetical protein